MKQRDITKEAGDIPRTYLAKALFSLLLLMISLSSFFLIWAPAISVFLARLLLVVGYLCRTVLGDSTLDIHIHDTYLVIATSYLFLPFALFFLLLWLIYRVARRCLLSNLLSWTHSIITLLTMFFIVAMTFKSGMISKQPNSNLWTTYEQYGSINNITTIAILVLLAGQFLLVVNIVGGFFNRRTNGY